jgi:hypothetical protein
LRIELIAALTVAPVAPTLDAHWSAITGGPDGGGTKTTI